MVSIVEDLKAQARRLHRQAASQDRAALARLGLEAGPEASEVQRRHCLAVIARELGFAGWPHLVAVLNGDDDTDFGKLLYPSSGSAHSNIWCATYDEARKIREQSGGYLLAYGRQYFIVDRYFIATLGLDPDDSDWESIGRDWVRPKDLDARQRLYRKLIQIRQNGATASEKLR
jgi:hypothetical protein